MPITVDECRKQFLRHIDEATNKGKDLIPRKNADSKDKFRYLLNPAITDISNKIKLYKTRTLYKNSENQYTGNSIFRLPSGATSIESVYNKGIKYDKYEIKLPDKIQIQDKSDQIEVTYSYVPDRLIIYDNVEDEAINNKNEETFLKQEIDLPDNICYLVALKVAGEALKAEDMNLSSYILRNFNNEVENHIALNQKSNKGTTYFERTFEM